MRHPAGVRHTERLVSAANDHCSDRAFAAVVAQAYFSAIDTAMPPSAERATVSHAQRLKPIIMSPCTICFQSYANMQTIEMGKAMNDSCMDSKPERELDRLEELLQENTRVRREHGREHHRERTTNGVVRHLLMLDLFRCLRHGGRLRERPAAFGTVVRPHGRHRRERVSDRLGTVSLGSAAA